MKRALLTAIICAVMAISSASAQHVQNLTFSGPANWTPGTTITLQTQLTYGGYSAYGLAYWLEVPNAIAPFLQLAMPTFFVFIYNGLPIWPAPFNSTVGADAGFMTEGSDLGAVNLPLALVPPGTYHITDLPFMVAAGAPAGTYTLHSTIVIPRTSEVSDQDFNDNNIPQASFVFNVVPEPSTLALVAFAAVSGGAFMYRRRNR